MHSFFEGLAPEVQQNILATYFISQVWSKKHLNTLFIIRSGQLRVELDDPGGRGRPRGILATLGPGDFVAEVNLFFRDACATVEAQGRCEVYALRGGTREEAAQHLTELFERYPRIAVNVTREMAWRLARSTRLAWARVRDRLRYHLWYVARETVGMEQTLGSVVITTTKERLSRQLFVVEKSVDDALRDLQDDKIVAVESGNWGIDITILDEDRLRDGLIVPLP